MNDFQNELQMLNVGDFQATQAVPLDQTQYYADQGEQFGFGIGGCFSCFSCGGFRCASCFSCGGFRCANCFSCGGFRCGGFRCGGFRCGGFRCHGGW